jgi:protein-glutamine gamma-glutamyltransferase
MRGLLSPNPAPAAAAAGPAGARPAGTGTARSAAAVTQDSFPLRLIAFAALAAFATAHWATLVENAPSGRTLLVVVVATGGAAALGLLSLAPLPRPALHALAAIVGVATLALGLMAAGLPGRLLLPAHWSELTDGLDRGLAGVQGVDWPYDGPDAWIRRTILLGAPALLGIAATLAFWPARRGVAALRIASLVALLLLYGTAVAEHDPGAPGLRGLALLLLIAGWLWLPRMPRVEAGVGAAVVTSVGVLSLPLAAALDGERPWWDYHAWNWFGDGKAITFDWTHEYGPLDWSRAGATVLNVKSDRPHYWKAETLDSFDGLRWVRSSSAERYGPEVAYRETVPEGRWGYNEYNPSWDERIRFTVRSLSSDMVVGAGITLRVDDIRGARPTSDGTTRLGGGRKLDRGDSYFVRTYAPNPTKAQMEGVPTGYSSNLIRYTKIQLPNPGDSATEGVAFQGDAAREQAALRRPVVFVPLRGNPDPENDGRLAERDIRRSPYERMYDLAQRLTADQPNAYAAVKNVEQYLQSTYRYAERVPTRPIPLMGFLYQERSGYCQQFSGAMALMLRMAGIPARVAAGFSPGSFNKDTEEYRVRDLDAHSWVEVWFQGIGWVPFDPTPARSPAQSQSSALATSAAAADAGEVSQIRRGVAASERGTDIVAGLGSEGGNGWLVPVLLLLVGAPLAGSALVLGRRVRRLRSLRPEELAEVQLSELRRALLRLGWDLPASTTLLGLERRLGRFAGPASEAYAEALRANRYDPRAPDAPGLGERRVVRRELTRGSLADRLRGLMAFPPGAPRP